uniref:Uncharacterized protein n=1 Tax=Romanomermis culicivorax TaxID=13658 RepID=A0A915ILV7_ROMCU
MSDYINSPAFFNLNDEIVRSQVAECPDLVSLQHFSYKISWMQMMNSSQGADKGHQENAETSERFPQT